MSTRHAPARPELGIFDEVMRSSTQVVVKELRELLGPRLVALIARVSETRAVHGWADGTREIRSPETEDRLRLALQLAKLITLNDSAALARTWFTGLNPKLGDVSPSRLLRDGDLHEVGPRLLAAARAFASVGA